MPTATAGKQALPLLLAGMVSDSRGEGALMEEITSSTPISVVISVIGSLGHAFEVLYESNAEDFEKTIFCPMLDISDTTGDYYADKFEEIEKTTGWEDGLHTSNFNRKHHASIAALMASCGFAIQAINAEKNSCSAWDYACKANRWLGILQGFVVTEILNIDNNSYALARKGGIAKNVPMAKLQEWVLQMYDDGKWPSKHKASIVIAPDAIKKAPEFNTRISSQRAQQTIYEWLRKHNIADN